MDKAIMLAAAACCCTAAASICQRIGAKSSATAGFNIGLVFRLARRPVWLLGIASMIAGFILQLAALRFGALALVQPILAAELVVVFGYLAVAGSGRVRRRDWLAATAMSAGIGVFLRVASPSGGRLHAPGSAWLVAGLAIVGIAGLVLIVSFGLGRRRGASGMRRAAVLGAATGISWGFMAAVIKELSSHLGDGIGALASSWSLYLLVAAGAATMLLASHALAAGPLAASQPGFTILDPLSASLLGVFLFGEHIRTGPADLVGEALALAVVIAAAAVLSHSCHTADQHSRPADLVTATPDRAANSPPAPAGRHARLPGWTETGPRCARGMPVPPVPSPGRPGCPRNPSRSRGRWSAWHRPGRDQTSRRRRPRPAASGRQVRRRRRHRGARTPTGSRRSCAAGFPGESCPSR